MHARRLLLEIRTFTEGWKWIDARTLGQEHTSLAAGGGQCNAMQCNAMRCDADGGRDDIVCRARVRGLALSEK